MKILLHCCCAVCASSCIQRLKDEGNSITLFFDNPNIYPNEERLKRFSNLRYLASIYNVDLILGRTSHQKYLEEIQGLEGEPERGLRCSKCFNLQFSLTYKEFIKNGNFDFWTTTLTLSRYKDSRQVFEQAEQFDNFLKIDFKKNAGEQKSNIISRAIGLYRQNYCGCEFSKGASKK